MPEQNYKSHPGLAAVLSFVFNGLGQLYNGEISKGLLIISLSLINISVVTIGGILVIFWVLGEIISNKILIFGLVLFFIGIISSCILGLYSIINAFRVAAKK